MNMMLKNGRSGVVACNGQMLINLIYKIGFEPRELSVRLGYEKSYFGKVLERNKIGTKAAKMLDEQFGIKPQQYGAAIEGKVEVLPVKRGRKKNENISDIIESPRIKPVVDNIDTGVIVLKVELDAAQLFSMVKQAVIEAFNNL